jgi:hypothetical protein
MPAAARYWQCPVPVRLMRFGNCRRYQEPTSSPTSSEALFEYALDRLPPPAFTAYGLQSIIQHVAHFSMGSGTGC